MECEFREKTILFFYRELNESEMRDFGDHIAQCPVCSRELETLRSLSGFLGGCSPSETVSEKIRAYSLAALFPKNSLSLPEKVYSLAFCLGLILLFAIPMSREKVKTYNPDLDSEISSVEKNLSALKYDFMDTHENDFDYRASNVNYSDINKNIL